ncbi:cation:H+ antiporter [Lachnospiraceae bacterium KH1T2]|nr:cation:H+ antiporter [Lachnospiraceae bacterium KH1T2]
MNTLIQIVILAVGFLCLIKGADIFVNGSSALAKRFNVSGLIIGLTIVALGTSAPEMAVSTLAAFQGSSEIALSNVVGSNIFNLLGVLGVCAVISPLPVDRGILKRDFPVTIITTALLLLVTCGYAFVDRKIMRYGLMEKVGVVTRPIGALSVALFVGYIIFLMRESKNDEADENSEKKIPMWKCVLLLIVGLVLVVAGGQAVVNSSKEIARAAGMTETLIGLTIVAVGTSLPELVTSIVATRKGETGMAIGNVLGSNIFNLLFILGFSGIIRPVEINMASVYDIMILIAISVISFIFALTSKKIVRVEGILMILIYIADVIFAAVR